MQASGLVLPPGTLPTIKLEGNRHTLKLRTIHPEEIPEIKVEYPDGFQKWHQAKDIVELLGKIGGTLKGRYGIEGYAILSTPGALELGDIDIEVTHGQ